MMAPGHALSGACAGYTTCSLYTLATQYEFHWFVPHAAAAVVAGWALWPDCDTLKSTVSTSLGIITKGLHHLVTTLCAAIYWATCTDADDQKNPKIHRGATHTWPGAVFMGLLIAVICIAYPRVGTPAILGISLHWAMRGLFVPNAIDKKIGKSKLKGKSPPVRILAHIQHWIGQRLKRTATKMMQRLPLPGKYLRSIGRSGTLGVCLGFAILGTEQTRALDTPWAALLGAAATLGILVHMLGDGVTESGICWKFPFIDAKTGKRWEEIALPKWLAFKTGHAFEIGIVWLGCFIACILTMPGGFALIVQTWTVWREAYVAAAALPFGAWSTTQQTQ